MSFSWGTLTTVLEVNSGYKQISSEASDWPHLDPSRDYHRMSHAVMKLLLMRFCHHKKTTYVHGTFSSPQSFITFISPLLDYLNPYFFP